MEMTSNTEMEHRRVFHVNIGMNLGIRNMKHGFMNMGTWLRTWNHDNENMNVNTWALKHEHVHMNTQTCNESMHMHT